uniref:Zgc:162297 n=1 Tax=Sinocyclocheilus grahami TaxID=75366 RepID=A0A672MQS1_SINGR
PGLRSLHDCTSHHGCHLKLNYSLTRCLMHINLCTGLDFIRAEGFVSSHVADEGLLNACAVIFAVLYPAWPLGVQILSAANHSVLAVALASGLDFIRAEGFVSSHVADEGLLNACAGELLRYHRRIGAEHLQIFTDIKKKHSAHALTSDVSIAKTAQAAEFFLSDGVIVTGSATGAQADPEELREVTQSVRIPVLIGSGVTHDNVEHYLQASAMIKKGGYWANGVDAESQEVHGEDT